MISPARQYFKLQVLNAVPVTLLGKDKGRITCSLYRGELLTGYKCEKCGLNHIQTTAGYKVMNTFTDEDLQRFFLKSVH